MAARWVALLVVAAMASAGCAGGTPEILSGLQGAGQGVDAGEGTSSIRGLVLDETSLPIAGAHVGIPKLDLLTTTGIAGDFAFRGLAAGTYQVFVQSLGYTSAARSVQVADDEAAAVEFVLTAIAIEEEFSEILGPFSGFVTCAATIPGVQGVRGSQSTNCNNGAFEAIMGEQKNILRFRLAQDNVWGVVGEMRWTATAYATSDSFALFFTHSSGYGSDWWCNAVGRSPIQFVYHVDDDKVQCTGRGSGTDGPPNTKQELHVTAYQGFHTIRPTDPTSVFPPNVAFQQRYESIVTVFYGLDPPAPYTAFPDS